MDSECSRNVSLLGVTFGPLCRAKVNPHAGLKHRLWQYLPGEKSLRLILVKLSWKWTFRLISWTIWLSEISSKGESLEEEPKNECPNMGMHAIFSHYLPNMNIFKWNQHNSCRSNHACIGACFNHTSGLHESLYLSKHCLPQSSINYMGLLWHFGTN